MRRRMASGFLVMLVLSGCGDSDGGSTGTVTSASPLTLAAAAPIFPQNGANWNTYVKGSNIASANDTPCNAATDTVCIHGGEARVVEALGKTSCVGLSATDSLGAFRWICDDSTGTARFISTGLATGSNLSDLVDFTIPGWKLNAVTVYDTGVAWGATPSSIWWSNPVALAPASGGSMSVEGGIYVVASDTTLTTGYTIDTDSVGLLIRPGAVLTGPGLGNGSRIVASYAHNYLWLEGTVRATDDDHDIYLQTVQFSRLRNVQTHSAGIAGVYFDGAAHNTIEGLTTTNNNFYGMALIGSSDNKLVAMMTNNNGAAGVSLESASNDNVLSGIIATNNGTYGIYIGNYAIGNRLSEVTAANNNGGIYLINSDNNTLAGVSACNNGEAFVLIGSSHTTLAGTTAASSTGYGYYVYSSSYNYFTDAVQVGQNGSDCYEGGGINPGIVSETCDPEGASDFGAPVTGITVASTFTAKVTVNDAFNASDVDGNANYSTIPSLFDWLNFEHKHRAWGLDGGAFPSVDNRGRWTTGSGRIWDWSLSSADTVVRNIFMLPTGNDIQIHTWSDTTTTTALRHAVELLGDGVGNDNLLCESSERCLFTPNMGGYHGHGELISAGAFTNGTLTNIELMKYENNGR